MPKGSIASTPEIILDDQKLPIPCLKETTETALRLCPIHAPRLIVEMCFPQNSERAAPRSHVCHDRRFE